MKILILEPAGNLWGSERVLVDFLGAKICEKHEIAICCPPNSAIIEKLEKLKVTIYDCFIANLHKKKKINRIIAAFRFLKVSLQFRPDIIYVNQAGSTKIALIISKIIKVPIITHVRLIEDVKYIENLKTNELQIPKIIVVSKYIGDEFSEIYKKRIEILYDAYVNEEENKINKEERVINKKQLNIACAGRLVKIKGQDVLIRAVHELVKEGIDVKLHIYGSGLKEEEYEEELKKLSIDLKIDNKIVFYGNVNNFTIHLAEKDILVCPSNIEPLGRVILEAWSMGKIPIASRFSGGAAEIINLSNGGILYEKQNPVSIANAIKLYINMTEENRKLIIEKGKKWLDENCESEKYAKSIIEILKLK